MLTLKHTETAEKLDKKTYEEKNLMMLSNLIKDLKQTLKDKGDLHILHVKITDEIGTSEAFLLSPKRESAKGYRARMNLKEFREYLKMQKKDKK